jgi:DNA-directed RNA polymerase specialized sigma24 family protein
VIELASVQPREDDRVAELVLAGVPEAHRLASWILRDPVGAEDAAQEALLRAWSRRRTIRFELGEPHRGSCELCSTFAEMSCGGGAASLPRR